MDLKGKEPKSPSVLKQQQLQSFIATNKKPDARDKKDVLEQLQGLDK